MVSLLFKVWVVSYWGLMMKRELAALSLDDKEDEIVEVQRQVELAVNENELCLVRCFLMTNVIHFPGYNDSFCQARMSLGIKVLEMGCDLTLRAQSMQVMTMNSVWLTDESLGVRRGVIMEGGVRFDRVRG
ncbi:hypothetical protein J1N35_030186 [Gossypium stocksii]|uniref:Uncharacterized protein n=1 Tax=Gossypium stocksii TaxID=47602 RepID=A0A9D3ZUH3_9ROSI|nr:hypothetical protein J1N35_030186 [Gossypium stocksii]